MFNRKKRKGRYIPLSDIEKINGEFLDEIERIKTRLKGVDDKNLINTFYNVLENAYNSEIEFQTCVREVDYDIKFTEMEQRSHNQKPWRRCWLWRLLLFPLTNRAQDIIEARAELDADIIHTAAEKEIEDERKKLLHKESDNAESKRELECKIKTELNEVIREADNADTNEIFVESKDVAQNLTQEQLHLNELPPISTRKPRPPRSCRKPTKPE